MCLCGFFRQLYDWLRQVSNARTPREIPSNGLLTQRSAFIGTTLSLPSFVAEFGFNEMSTHELSTTKETIVSLYQAGAFFGSLFAYGSAYFLGRKKSLMIFSVIFILGAGLMLGANGDRGLGLILGGRVLAGIGVGACSMIVPIYISEISPPAVRGRLVGIYELGWQVGGLVGFVSSSYHRSQQSIVLTTSTVDQLRH